MNFRKTIKSNKHTKELNGFLANQQPVSFDTLEDVIAVNEPYMSPELEAAVSVIQDGGLHKLSALQQKIFQLYVVEGLLESEVAKALRISQQHVSQQLKAIGLVLKPLCVERM